jgi:hypothetical protein
MVLLTVGQNSVTPEKLSGGNSTTENWAEMAPTAGVQPSHVTFMKKSVPLDGTEPEGGENSKPKPPSNTSTA